MRYSPEHKNESRTKLLAAAGRGFRRRGFGGIGVDGLAKEGGVTSGAFYGHFKSKDKAFKEVMVAGIEELRHGVASMQQQHGRSWIEPFVEFYLGQKRTCELGMSCALQSLTPDVQRAGANVKKAFDAEVQKLITTIAVGLTGDNAKAKAWALMSLLSGAVTVARASDNPATGEVIAASARLAALAIAGDGGALSTRAETP